MGFLAERSFSAMARRSASSIADPAFHSFASGLGILIAGGFAVIDDDQGESAGSHASRREQRDLAVGRGLAG
jgi:hypothetical protein